MIKNYFLVAWRQLFKNKVFSLINIFGLSTGIACCVLIALYVQDELNYEKGFPEHEKIFRINTMWTLADGKTETGAVTSPPIAVDIANELPDVDGATRVLDMRSEQHIVRYQDETFFENNVILVDSNFFDVFRYRLKEGNARSVFEAPSTIVISEEFSIRVFGERSPLDEFLIIHSGPSTDTFRITGVVERSKYPSHLDAHLYMSMDCNSGAWLLSQTTWADNNIVNGFLKLEDPASYKALESKLPALLERHAGEVLRASGRKKTLLLQPLDEIRLYSEMLRSDGRQSRSSIAYVRTVGMIGIFILVLACINFMNLTTARSTQRAGEVGVRKTMGAYKRNLVGQFLGESGVIVLIAMVFSFALVSFLLPTFNHVMQKNLSLNSANLPVIIPATIVICVITALLAGSYPAFFLSSLKPTEVLKAKGLTVDASQWIRKGLVVFQFLITTTLISSILIMQRQMKFMQTTSLGFKTEEVVLIPMRTHEASSQYPSLKTQFEQLSGVKSVSAATSLPSTPLNTDWLIYKQGTTRDQASSVHVVRIDKDYFSTLGTDLIIGRDFIIEQDNRADDTVNLPRIIVNESTLSAFDIPLDDAIGTELVFQPGDTPYRLSIIGVVEDFHQFSLHRDVVPMMFFLPSSRNYFRYAAATIDPQAFDQLREQMEDIWDGSIQTAPFEITFMNENIKQMYLSEKRTSTILLISTIIAVIISCLGLYGLSLYTAERRIKEIGIRKIVGASIRSVVIMLSVDHIRLIGISFLMSVPAGYLLMEKWLENFAYRINPGVWTFVLSGLIALLLGWLTVSFESMRAASRNPADTLRNG